MSKWYEIKIRQYKTVVVEMEDNQSLEDAFEAVIEDQIGEWEGFHGSQLKDGYDTESAKRHADEVLPL